MAHTITAYLLIAAQHSFISETTCYGRYIFHYAFDRFTHTPGLGIFKVAILESKVINYSSKNTSALLSDHIKVLARKVADSLGSWLLTSGFYLAVHIPVVHEA